jgi:hypothetical protein
MTNYSTQTIRKWVLNVECMYYVYEIKHKKLCDHTIVPLNQWLLMDLRIF